MTTSEDDYRTGCRNVSHRQQQQSYSGLRSPGRSNLTYFSNDSWAQTFHSFNLFVNAKTLTDFSLYFKDVIQYYYCQFSPVSA